MPQSPGWGEPAPASRPIIPSSQSSFAEFRKQALEKEERVHVAIFQWKMAATLCHLFFAGENPERTRATKVTTEKTDGTRTTETA